MRKLLKMRQVVGVVIGIVLAIWLASGIYTVGPGALGVVRQFGRFISQTGPGLNYRLPWPIQAHDVVNVAGIRRAEIGFMTVEEQPGRPERHVRVPDEAIMLTGDKNIADVQVLVLYQVVDAEKFLFRAESPERALEVNAEVALRSAIGEMTIDHAMTVGRPEVETETWEFLQFLLDSHLTGLHVVGVELQVVDPPDEVREAFYNVVRAKADRERLIREAEGYARDVVPRARGEAAAMVHAATAFRDERIALAEGEAARFGKILEEYRKAPAVTRQRLFLETIERVLAETENFIIDPAVGGNLMPFLPLGDLIELEEPAEGEE
ncbi:MAG TPA: FtsH protease activity modulator HflK [Atribacteraceae bacterium]|nr:FtsH protease activity modulator HflK [Atribacteraceae bacterium]